MSRRKQSNPKPLKGGEDEEWGSEGEGERASEGAAPAPASSPTPTPPPAPQSPAPKLRLNPSLATDPALRASAVPPALPAKTEPPASPADLEYLATLPSALQTAIVAGRLFCIPPGEPTVSSAPTPSPARKPDSSDSKQVSGPVYVCTPCAIKFSSLSTLEAHQTYYCSHRHATQPKVAGVGAAGGEGGGDSETEDVKPVVGGEAREESGGESTGEPATKSTKSGKLYRCPHCSYSADKKVSLNRHMRMHSSSPASQTSTDATDGGHLIDRYCQDCDIRFSSLKTFKAHKMHYCSTRHVIKSKPTSAPSSPSESRTTPTSPGASESSNHPPPPPQPFLALPTNPILIVPYSLFQGASILSGPAVMGLPAQDTACLLLPDGTLQPLAQGLLSQSRIPPPTPEIKRQRLTSETIVKHSEESRSKNGMGETPGAPLDLSVRTREEEGDLVIDMEEEDEKENRRSVDNQANIFPSPDPEDIICAPSIPLILSTSSTCSTPSPAPPSPALSSSSIPTSNRKLHDSKRHRTDSQGSSPSPKSSPSGAKSPRRTPNGLPNMIEKNHKSSDSKRKSSFDSISSPKLDCTNNNLTLSSLLLAAAAQGGIDGYHKPEAGLPFPPELVPHLTGARLPGGKGKPISAIPGLIPATNRNLPLLLPKPPRTPADLMNPATILPLLTSEMALRIAAATGDPVTAPQVLVKQGVSKCQECNIVFCKHENFIAHKKHYCSARQLNEPVIVQDDDIKPASPAVSVSPPNTASPPTVIKDQSHSPVNPTAINPVASISKPPTLYQFICAACGIKFTSYDNLTAHQAYYCPKRTNTDSEKGSRRCPKCKMTVAMDHVCGGSGGAWKCPCCHVVSPTASAAQKHMDTHTGVKAFLCTICRYKGNTLRGMRTHIRMHFDKRSNEIMEENYITCLVEDGSGGSVEIPAIDGEETHLRKTSENNNSSNRNVNVNGDTKVKIKQELDVGRTEEEEEEYIEVDEVATVKTDKSQDCKDTKNGECRTRFCSASRVT